MSTPEQPTLPDPRDEFVLELAVGAECRRIVSHNTRDFAGSERFGVQVMTPRQFLQEIGDRP